MAKVSSIERNNKRKKLVKSLILKRKELKERIYSKDLAIDENKKTAELSPTNT